MANNFVNSFASIVTGEFYQSDASDTSTGAQTVYTANNGSSGVNSILVELDPVPEHINLWYYGNCIHSRHKCNTRKYHQCCFFIRRCNSDSWFCTWSEGWTVCQCDRFINQLRKWYVQGCICTKCNNIYIRTKLWCRKRFCRWYDCNLQSISYCKRRSCACKFYTKDCCWSESCS